MTAPTVDGTTPTPDQIAAAVKAAAAHRDIAHTDCHTRAMNRLLADIGDLDAMVHLGSQLVSNGRLELSLSTTGVDVMDGADDLEPRTIRRALIAYSNFLRLVAENAY